MDSAAFFFQLKQKIKTSRKCCLVNTKFDISKTVKIKIFVWNSKWYKLNIISRCLTSLKPPKSAVTMNHSQQLELSLGKRTELICIPNNTEYHLFLPEEATIVTSWITFAFLRLIIYSRRSYWIKPVLNRWTLARGTEEVNRLRITNWNSNCNKWHMCSKLLHPANDRWRKLF